MTAAPPRALPLEETSAMAITPVTSDREQLPELLRICEDFFAQCSPAGRGELDALLRARGITGGPGRLVDMLALTRLGLPSRPSIADFGASEPAGAASGSTESGRPAR
jgi:hypothetical protein